MPSFLGKLALSLIPLSLTPVWGYLIAESYLNFGAGEKDLFLLVPWMVWSLIYFPIFVGAWIKRKPLKRILVYALGGATGLLVVIWIVMFIWFKALLGVSATSCSFFSGFP